MLARASDRSHRQDGKDRYSRSGVSNTRHGSKHSQYLGLRVVHMYIRRADALCLEYVIFLKRDREGQGKQMNQEQHQTTCAESDGVTQVVLRFPAVLHSTQTRGSSPTESVYQAPFPTTEIVARQVASPDLREAGRPVRCPP